MNTDRPWMTALEMQFAALALVKKFHASAPSVGDAISARWLPSCAPFYWSPESVAAVQMASASIPDDARFDDDLLPDRLQAAWWWLGSPIPYPLKPTNSDNADNAGVDRENISAMLLAQEADGTITLALGRMTTLGIPFITNTHRIARNASLRELSADGDTGFDISTGTHHHIRPRDIALFRFIMAASVWLKQRVVATSLNPAERHLRKRVSREHGLQSVPEIRVIALRRAESRHDAETGAPDHTEWSCRWIVNGHWRNQPYKDGSKLIYILPYVKGPDDKPLKVPTHTVYQVSR